MGSREGTSIRLSQHGYIVNQEESLITVMIRNGANCMPEARTELSETLRKSTSISVAWYRFTCRAFGAMGWILPTAGTKHSKGKGHYDCDTGKLPLGGGSPPSMDLGNPKP